MTAENEEAVFECTVVGEPRPQVTWYLNGEVLAGDERVKITSEESGHNVLRITSTRPEDKGNYVAKATNHAGEAKSFAKLVVKVLSDFQIKETSLLQTKSIHVEEKHVAPYFKEKFDDRTVPNGVTTKFECIVAGKPAPKVSFLVSLCVFLVAS